MERLRSDAQNDIYLFFFYFFVINSLAIYTLNPLQPSDAVRKKKKIFSRIFLVQFCHNLKKYHPSGNLKFNNLGIFPSLKLRNLMGKILPISLQLNFTPNALGCHGLKKSLAPHLELPEDSLI